MRRIMHIDMDAFFASVEQRDQPNLKGKPVIVGIKGTRGVVSTCSYEARRYGVRSAMPIALAEKKCPKGIFIHPNPQKYEYISIKVIEILSKYSLKVEPTSIDEAYLDITGKNHIDEEKTAISIKNEIRENLGITCSVGIASNRVYAKIAANMQKPDGLTILNSNEEKQRIYPLPISELVGVGEKSEDILKRMRLNTIGSIAECPETELERVFGKNGLELKKIAKGEGSDKVCTFGEEEDVLSIGNEHTLENDTSNTDFLNTVLLKLTEKVARRLREANYSGRTVTVKFRYSDFETHTKRVSFPFLLREDEKIYSIAKGILHSSHQKGRKIRLIGITVSGLIKSDNAKEGVEMQTDLFQNCIRSEKIIMTIDSLKNRFGESVVFRAGGISVP